MQYPQPACTVYQTRKRANGQVVRTQNANNGAGLAAGRVAPKWRQNCLQTEIFRGYDSRPGFPVVSWKDQSCLLEVFRRSHGRASMATRVSKSGVRAVLSGLAAPSSRITRISLRFPPGTCPMRSIALSVASAWTLCLNRNQAEHRDFANLAESCLLRAVPPGSCRCTRPEWVQRHPFEDPGASSIYCRCIYRQFPLAVDVMERFCFACRLAACDFLRTAPGEYHSHKDCVIRTRLCDIISLDRALFSQAVTRFLPIR
jgi:hypothetical protein